MRSRRTLLAILGGIAAFAIVIGSAATLGGLGSDDLGSDDSVVASCDTTGGVTTAYTNVYNTTTTPTYKVDKVTVSALDAACLGQSMTITLSGASDASLEQVTKTVTGASDVVEFANTTASEDVTGLHIVITG